ncbi:MAG TPA: phenylphosphate carboxylase subunit gamma [Syntrophorhabdaceae bacterium]|jgi:phenylphosphate carboxylase gamma subunit
MAEYDTYINTDFADLKEDVELTGVIRDLAPGRRKYRSTYARFMVSKTADKYKDKLQVRLGRGQLVDTPCSIEVIETFNVIPKGL